jgi:hypothetical protein
LSSGGIDCCAIILGLVVAIAAFGLIVLGILLEPGPQGLFVSLEKLTDGSHNGPGASNLIFRDFEISNRYCSRRQRALRRYLSSPTRKKQAERPGG